MAVGRSGAAAHSADGGASWTPASPASPYLNGVVSDNRGRFVAVGANETVLIRDLAGAWSEVDPGLADDVVLQAVAWDDQGRLVAVGSRGTVILSVDGGRTWSPGDSGVTESLLSVTTDGRGTWVAGGPQGMVLRSTDGGETWTQGNIGEGVHVNDLVALDSLRWVAVGLAGVAARSTDGGVSWQPGETGVALPLEGVATDGDGGVVAVGWSGSVVRSDDGGETWSVVEVPTTQRLTAVASGSPGHFVVVGWRGTALRSADGGRSWTESPTGSRAVFESVAFDRRPDLRVTSVTLDEGCRVVARVENRGPATLPLGAWDSDLPGLALVKGDEPWAQAPMDLLDPDRSLRTPGGSLGYTFDAVVGDTVSLAVVADPDGALAERSEGNNRAPATLVCPPSSEPGRR